jgi:hypothetical protein
MPRSEVDTLLNSRITVKFQAIDRRFDVAVARDLRPQRAETMPEVT